MTLALRPPHETYRFSTDDLPPRQAFDAYHAIMRPGAEPVRLGSRFQAAMSGLRLPHVALHRRSIHGVAHRRDAACVRRSDFTHCTVTLCLAGEVAVRTGDVSTRLAPGQLMLFDLHRPSELLLDGAEVMTVAIARDVLASAFGDPDRVHGRLFDANRTAPLRRLLLDLMAAPDGVGGGDQAATMIADQLAMMTDPAEAEAPRRARARARFTMRRLIEARIDDPAFDVATLARETGMSRASLYRLFEPVGGVARHLLDLRLVRLRQWLTDPGETAPVGALADRAGLVSESHASRAFLQRFGRRPGAWRRQAAQLTDADMAAMAMRSWQDLLR